MNDLSALDIPLYGALSGAAVVAVCAVLWALAYRGRKRWSADRADQVVADGIRILVAGPGDAVVVTYPGTMSQEQRAWIIEAIERRLPKGVNAMVMDGGLNLSHVVSSATSPGHVALRPIPQPAPAA
jgi:hypothetical protein